jgi:hypothetical protein
MRYASELTDSTVILEGIVMLLLRAAGVNRAPLARASMSLEIPSAEVRWYLGDALLVRLKLKLHRLKPDGISRLRLHWFAS